MCIDGTPQPEDFSLSVKPIDMECIGNNPIYQSLLNNTLSSKPQFTTTESNVSSLTCGRVPTIHFWSLIFFCFLISEDRPLC